jgi:hypothetical protein
MAENCLQMMRWDEIAGLLITVAAVARGFAMWRVGMLRLDWILRDGQAAE